MPQRIHIQIHKSKQQSNIEVSKASITPPTILNHNLGLKNYELSNHLGNATTVISDRKIPRAPLGSNTTIAYYMPDIVSATDYYPFGMTMQERTFSAGGEGYRFGFNGKENDNEISVDGGNLDFGARIYDSRLGRWMSVDPITEPSQSCYVGFDDNPIFLVDEDGESGRAYRKGNTITIRSRYYFYGSKLTAAQAKQIALNIQTAFNKANGKVVIKGKTYNVKFQVTAVAVLKLHGETEEAYTKRVGDKIMQWPASPGQNVREADIQNNFVRIVDDNIVHKSFTEQNSGCWLEGEVIGTTPSHEFWHGLMMNGLGHLEICEGANARIACAKGSGCDADSRIVKQADIDDINLEKVFFEGKGTGPVGEFGNVLYNNNGERDPIDSNVGEKNNELRRQRGDNPK